MAEQIDALQNLYEDQEPDLVADTIPAVLAWLGPSSDAAEPSASFKVRLGEPGIVPTEDVLLRLGWDAQALERRCPGTPGRRAITFCEGLPPDILFDDTDGAVRGVEASGRTSGGFGALRVVLEGTKENPGGKRAQLAARSDVAEAHVSLWCIAPPVALLLQVKP